MIDTDFKDEMLNEYMQSLGAKQILKQTEYEALIKGLSSFLPLTDSDWQNRNWWVFENDLELEGEQAQQLFSMKTKSAHCSASVIINGNLSLKKHGYWEVGGQAIIVKGALTAPVILVENHLHVEKATSFDSLLYVSSGGYETDISNPIGPLCIKSGDASYINEINRSNLEVMVSEEDEESYGNYLEILKPDIVKKLKHNALEGEGSIAEIEADWGDVDTFYRCCLFSFSNGEKEAIAEGKMKLLV